MTSLSTSLSLTDMPIQATSKVLDFLYGTQDNGSLRASCKTFNVASKKIPKGVNPDSLSIKEVVNYMLPPGKKGYSLEKQEYYTESEEILRNLKERRKEGEPLLLQGFDSYECLGGIGTSMSFPEVEAYVQNKFDQLRKSNLLLYRSEFEAQEKPEKFRKPGNQKLSRLWGAEYLRTQLATKEGYKVPRFVIVVKDGVKNLPIKLWNFNPELISISSIETRDAELLVENIETGIPSARNLRHRWMTGIGYVDYGDPGNILKADDGNYYVVDTEWTALEGCKTNKREKESSNERQLREYTEERFAKFNPWLSKIVSVSLRAC